MLNVLRSLSAYQQVLEALRDHAAQPGLGLPRSARLPVAAALAVDLPGPLLIVTDRADHALMLYDELGFWAPHATRYLFPEPTPLFYEQAAWGAATRRDRLQALTSLAIYHMPGVPRPGSPTGAGCTGSRSDDAHPAAARFSQGQQAN